MDIEAWKQAWDHFVIDPGPFGSALVVLVSAAWLGAWFLRGHTVKERIAALEERLRLAKDEQESIARQAGKLLNEIFSQQVFIEQLRAGVTAAKLDNLSHTSSAVVLPTQEDLQKSEVLVIRSPPTRRFTPHHQRAVRTQHRRACWPGSGLESAASCSRATPTSAFRHHSIFHRRSPRFQPS
jgi:hypothetical protein